MIVGIDIGDDFNAVGFMNKAGNVLGRLPKMYKSEERLDKSVRIAEELKTNGGSRIFLSGA